MASEAAAVLLDVRDALDEAIDFVAHHLQGGGGAGGVAAGDCSAPDGDGDLDGGGVLGRSGVEAAQEFLELG